MLRTYENSLIEPVLGQMPAVPALTSNSPLLRCSAPFTNLAGCVEASKLAGTDRSCKESGQY